MTAKVFTFDYRSAGRSPANDVYIDVRSVCYTDITVEAIPQVNENLRVAIPESAMLLNTVNRKIAETARDWANGLPGIEGVGLGDVFVTQLGKGSVV